MVVVKYVIEVAFSSKATEEDTEELLEELIDTATRYGSEADGYIDDGRD